MQSKRILWHLVLGGTIAYVNGGYEPERPHPLSELLHVGFAGGLPPDCPLTDLLTESFSGLVTVPVALKESTDLDDEDIAALKARIVEFALLGAVLVSVGSRSQDNVVRALTGQDWAQGEQDPLPCDTENGVTVTLQSGAWTAPAGGGPVALVSSEDSVYDDDLEFTPGVLKVVTCAVEFLAAASGLASYRQAA